MNDYYMTIWIQSDNDADAIKTAHETALVLTNMVCLKGLDGRSIVTIGPTGIIRGDSIQKTNEPAT